MGLRAARRLPRAWDGMHVEWETLAGRGGSIEIHFPHICDACGSDRAPWYAGGRVKHTDPRTGRAHHVVRFVARRCRDCHHDEVYDKRAGQWWELGPEDYGPEGSHEVVERAGGAQ